MRDWLTAQMGWVVGITSSMAVLGCESNATLGPEAYAQAEVYFDQGRYTEAYGAYKTALDVDPQWVHARIGAAKSLVMTEQFDVAIEILDELTREGIDSPLIHYWRKRAQEGPKGAHVRDRHQNPSR